MASALLKGGIHGDAIQHTHLDLMRRRVEILNQRPMPPDSRAGVIPNSCVYPGALRAIISLPADTTISVGAGTTDMRRGFAGLKADLGTGLLGRVPETWQSEILMLCHGQVNRRGCWAQANTPLRVRNHIMKRPVGE